MAFAAFADALYSRDDETAIRRARPRQDVVRGKDAIDTRAGNSFEAGRRVIDKGEINWHNRMYRSLELDIGHERLEHLSQLGIKRSAETGAKLCAVGGTQRGPNRVAELQDAESFDRTTHVAQGPVVAYPGIAAPLDVTGMR